MDNGRLKEIKKKILTKISNEELEERIKKEISQSSGLMDENAAILVIASDLKIDIDQEYDEEEYNFSIKDISNGQSNVEITGKILEISNIKEFNRKDGSTGKIRSISIADNTGIIRLVLWNDKVHLADDLNVGDVIRVENAFSRKWRDKIELNSGSNLIIEKLEKYDKNKYPEIKEVYTIGELTPNMPAKVRGEVISIYDTREFDKRDGSVGKVKSFILRDDEGTLRCTLWDDLTDIQLNRGDVVEVSGIVREGLRGLEISVNDLKVIKKEECVEVPTVDISQLSDYEGDVVSIKGRVTHISTPKTVKFNDRETALQEITLMDNSGSVRVSFWGRNTEMLEDIKEGDPLHIMNCRVKSYLTPEGEKIIHLSAQYDSKVIKDESIKAPEYKENLIEIKDIKGEDAREDITLVGRVLQVYDINQFERKDGTTGTVRNIMLEDCTGRIRLVLWDNNALLDIKEGDIVKVVHGYVRDSGEYVDLHVGRYGRIIINPEGIDLDIKTNRKFIKELTEGETAEIRGTVVDYRKQDLILYLCPNCGKRASLVDDKYLCNQCGEVNPRELPIITLILDDGTSNISCNLYGKMVERILNMSQEELKSANIEILENLLGQEKVFTGVVNKGYRDLEFSVKGLMEFDLDKEIEFLKNIQ
ncbi:MAG TPA: replication factor A [Methanothermococcus okinawensis]|uniref:Replication factor A n=1 Tax=Methanothermococcus okinawensis TaxID=155863 RepID=A0A832YTW4_9EURY|nr:replication factor A [Methanothermococcus okinawensis]